ncbi:uncharacterized protein JN550_013057 [Neoarthrinium moseri]|uniref:uncharacterized protein n=1 Tax=Neoarthrinium moseri TaxID=1658444 RepID=UPI001FDB1271|nr:uncharacterized protein JN550_013057 [Neoarthrinium moseri]KAI1857794.1 hypothetical protein JN550_013057 [Neoarthrinium moseri]
MADGEKINTGPPVAKAAEDEVPPPYNEFGEGPSAPMPSTSALRNAGQTGASAQGPTVADPFDFPTDVPAPAYTESSSAPIPKPIAIPQLWPDAAAPFLPAYSPSLLRHGIPDQSWGSFLDTLSAFLTAKVSDRAISHAADIGRHVGNVPKRFGKNVATHAKSIGREIAGNAKKGNIIGAAFGVIGGAISLPVATAFGAVGAITSLPASTASAVARKPQTARERAVAYTAVANKDWFNARNLQAQLMDTSELSQLVGMSTDRFLQLVASGKDESAEAQLGILRTNLAELELKGPATLAIAEKTLWLVVVDLKL